MTDDALSAGTQAPAPQPIAGTGTGSETGAEPAPPTVPPTPPACDPVDAKLQNAAALASALAQNPEVLKFMNALLDSGPQAPA